MPMKKIAIALLRHSVAVFLFRPAAE